MSQPELKELPLAIMVEITLLKSAFKMTALFKSTTEADKIMIEEPTPKPIEMMPPELPPSKRLLSPLTLTMEWLTLTF